MTKPQDRSSPHLVAFIHGGNAIDAQSSFLIGRRLRYFGYELVDFSVTDGDCGKRLSSFLRARRDDIFCFLSSNFWALNVTQNDELLHKATGIPLVILLHDHPLHFLPVVSRVLDDTITFAPGSDGVDFVKKYYPYRTVAVANPSGPSTTLDGESPRPDHAEFMSRENALLCPMNLTVEQGENIDDVWNTINLLPADRRARTKRIIDACLTDCITPLHVMAEKIASESPMELILEDLFHVLNFTKLWRRTRLVEMLIELPVLFSSNYVPAMLARKYPEKFKLLSVPETIDLYSKFRYVVNSTPVMTGIVHDRIAQALHHNSVCVTDENAIIRQHFSRDDMAFIDYEASDLARQIGALLDDPDRAYELTVHCRDVWTATTFTVDAYAELFRVISHARERPRA